jgi:hypothetical protein
MELDTSGADKEAAAAARKAAADAKRRAADARRAASEQERAAEKYNNYLQQGADLANDLTQQIKQISIETKAVGETPTKSILLSLEKEYNEITFDQAKLAATFNELVKQTGLRFDGLRSKIEELRAAKIGRAQAVANQSLLELLPGIAEYDAKIAEVKQGKTELTEVEKLNAQINLLQLDVLAATNPALAEHVRLLRERAGTLDVTTAKQEQLNAVNERNKQLAEGVAGTIGGGLSSAMDLLIEGTEEWGSSLKEIASGVLKDIARQLVQTMVIAPIVKGITKGFGFADGGIMSPSGPVPLKTYSRGGIANSPQLALYGEGSMNEAYVPLPDGRRIPVALQGGRGGGSSTNVVINVDASGTKASGDPGAGNALARDLAAVVDARLLHHKRPGGILA